MRTHNLRGRAPLFGLFVSLGLLAGCATQEAQVFDKPGLLAGDRERDENACLRSSIGLENDRHILMAFAIDHDAYARCMETRGYSASQVR